MKTLADYALDLKKAMEEVRGEDIILDNEYDDINSFTLDLKAEAKEELREVGISVETEDIILLGYVYRAISIHMIRNETNKIMDEHEDVVDRFEALLHESGVPEEEVPEILSNVFVDEKFNQILSLKYKSDVKELPLTEYSKFLLSKINNEFKYIPPHKLIHGGTVKIFKLFYIEGLEPVEILYVLSLFNLTGNDIHVVLDDYLVDINLIYRVQSELKEEMELAKATPPTDI